MSDMNAERRDRRAESVIKAVESDNRRRRRLLLLLLFLFVTSIAIGILLLIYGRSDVELVNQEVTRKVLPVQESYNQVKPRLDQIQNVGTILDEVTKVSQDFNQRMQALNNITTRLDKQEQQLTSLDESQKQLTNEISPVKVRLQEIEPTISQVQPLTSSLQDVRSQVQQQESRLTSIQQQQESAAGVIKGGPLSTLLAMVLLILILGLIVQSIQVLVGTVLKLKSRQIEDSLAHLFQFALHDETVVEKRIWGRWGWFNQIKEMVAQSPFLRIFTTISHPADRAAEYDKEYAHAAAVYNEVLNKFRGIGRTALSTRPIFDSMSKGDLMKVVASIEPAVLDNEFADKVTAAAVEFKKFYAVFDEWKEWFGGPDFKVGQYLGEDDRARLAELQAKFKPLVDDLKRLLAPGGDPAEVVKAVAADIIRLRSLNLGDARKVLDDVRANARFVAERAQLDGKPDVADVLDLFVARLDSFAGNFVGFRKAYEAVFTNWAKLEESFDMVMLSFEERYSRAMKILSFILSLVIAVGLNIDLFYLYNSNLTFASIDAVVLPWLRGDFRHGLLYQLGIILSWLITAALLSNVASLWRNLFAALPGPEGWLRKKTLAQ